jgi:Uma2 family endonuclease
MGIPGREPIRYTYANLKDFPEDARRELEEGYAIRIEAPTFLHQEVSSNLHFLFREYLNGKPCNVYYAPLDVRLFYEDDDRDDTVYQPDLLILCDKRKRGDKAILGAPDLVVEITSASTSKRDRWTKKYNYRKAGVREYWVVDTQSALVEQYVFAMPDQSLDAAYDITETIPVYIFPGFQIAVKDILPPPEA